MAGLFGGMLVAWSYGDISPTAFRRVVAGRDRHEYLPGRPHQGAVHGAGDRAHRGERGMATAGSSELLGRQVTASVVKAIFMVIVIDGLFAMFFAAIHY